MWKSEFEILKTYTDHIQSLESSGVEFDLNAVIEQRDKDIIQYREEQNRKFES